MAIGTETKVSIGVALTTISTVFMLYKSSKADIMSEVDKKVEQQVYEVEQKIQDHAIESAREELLLRLDLIQKDIGYIKEKLDKEG